MAGTKVSCGTDTGSEKQTFYGTFPVLNLELDQNIVFYQ